MENSKKNSKALISPLIEYAKSRSDDVTRKLRSAMVLIEREIEDNNGIYPHKKRKLSMAEVCRRAGVHKITLQGEAHRSTIKPILKEWLDSVNKRSVISCNAAGREVCTTIEDWKRRYIDLARLYHEIYAIEVISRDVKLEAAVVKIADLEREIFQLRTQLSNGAVVSMQPHNRKRK